MVLPLPVLRPRRKVTQFTIISIVSEPHFRADQQDLLVMEDHPTIVDDVLVHDGPAHGARSDKAF